jgi:ABC-type nitrate/sulfonate/bicarbonate transport system substrate-binding protein
MVNRRKVLLGGVGLGGLALASPLLAACGGSSGGGGSSSGAGSSGSTAKDFGALTVRLSWIKNAEFSGEYIADNAGYYKAEGFSSVKLISGGASATPQDTDVASGVAMFGISAPDITGAAIAQGAPLKIIGAQYQKNPFAVMSMAATPITKPTDMYGKKIGVQATNESVWSSFLTAAKLDASKITKVTVEFDPLPLTQGVVDGWFSFVTNEPNALKAQGFKTTTFLLADYGYPLVSETYMTLQSTIDKKRDLVKAFLRAEIKGWTDSLKDPAVGAKLAAGTYGSDLGLDVTETTAESASQNTLILNADTKKNGIFTVSDALVTENIAILASAGLKLKASDIFDFSILEEVYKEDPSLISALPAIPTPASS